MKYYGISNEKREKVQFWVVIFSFILGEKLFPIAAQLLRTVLTYVPMVGQFINDMEYTGLISAPLTVVFFYELLMLLIDRVFWKRKLFRWWSGVPDLNGVWTGTFLSTWSENENGAGTSGEMTMIISQTWTKMACQCKFKKSDSYSDIVYLDVDCTRGTLLQFTYINRSHDIELRMPMFPGYNELVLSKDGNSMTGTYFTQRISPTQGYITLERSNNHDGDCEANSIVNTVEK